MNVSDSINNMNMPPKPALTTDTKRQLKDIKDEQKDLAKSTNNAAKSWTKFKQSIGRIALYRAIRSVLKEITQSLKEGLENIRQVDSGLDKTLNQFNEVHRVIYERLQNDMDKWDFTATGEDMLRQYYNLPEESLANHFVGLSTDEIIDAAMLFVEVI